MSNNCQIDNHTRNILRRCLMLLKTENLDKKLRLDLEELLLEDIAQSKDPEPVKEVMHTLLGTQR